MNKEVIAISTCLIILASCTVPVEFDQCISRSDEGHNIALSKELSNRNIKHKLEGNQLCYKKADYNEVGRASGFVDTYRHGVATVLTDIATEKRIVNWLTSEKKYYNITPTTDGDRFLVILSDNQEDEEANRKELIRLENIK